MLFHRIEEPADYDTKVTPSTFKDIIDYLATTNVEVVTMSDVF
ncbi:MAG: hypothetical protein Q7J27_00785 [Syntrophales bacterium]|nr:hypothetical protein [Syntrophales bacterium]